MEYVLIVIGIFTLEMLVKRYVERRFTFDTQKEVLGGRVTLKKLHNKGAVLGFLKGRQGVLKFCSSLLLILLILSFQMMLRKKEKPLTKTGCALLMAGAASNMYDRFKRGYVVDYFSLKVKPIQNVVFNLSDFFIFIGSLFILIFGGKTVSR